MPQPAVWVPLEKAMAPHSSVLAQRIPGTEEPGGLPFLGSHRVGHGLKISRKLEIIRQHFMEGWA